MPVVPRSIPYTPVNWQDGVTPVNAANLNNMEDLLEALAAGAGAGGGGGLDWEGAWAAPTAYVKGDVVIHNGVVYGAVNDSTGQTPPAYQPAAAAVVPIPLVTTLPTSPFDGQEVILTDSLTAPTYTWRLRYHAASTAAYKWEFVGGSDLVSHVTASETTTAFGDFVNLATLGPRVTVPRAGDYLIACACSLTNNNVQTNAQMVIGPGDYTLATIGSEVYAQGVGGVPVSGMYVTFSTFGRALGVAAGTELRMKYYYSAAGTLTVQSRMLRVLPVRLS